MDKIAYSDADRAESLRLFLTEVNGILAEFEGVKLSVAVPAELLDQGTNDLSGQSLAAFAALADAIYAPCGSEAYEAAKTAVTAAAPDAAFVALFDGQGDDGQGDPPEEYLIPQA